MVQLGKRAQGRRDATLLRNVLASWRRHSKQEQLFRLAARRRLLRQCMAGWAAVAKEEKRALWAEAQAQALQNKRTLRAVLRAWSQLTADTTATRQDGLAKAALHRKRWAWGLWVRRAKEQRLSLAAQGRAVEARLAQWRLRRGLREWARQGAIAGFEVAMLRKHPDRVPTTPARCLQKWVAWTRQQRATQAALAKARRHWEARVVVKAVGALVQQARTRRRARAASSKATKALGLRRLRQALLWKWAPRTDASRARRVLVEKGILTRRRRALRKGVRAWAAWTRAGKATSVFNVCGFLFLSIKLAVCLSVCVSLYSPPLSLCLLTHPLTSTHINPKPIYPTQLRTAESKQGPAPSAGESLGRAGPGLFPVEGAGGAAGARAGRGGGSTGRPPPVGRTTQGPVLPPVC